MSLVSVPLQLDSQSLVGTGSNVCSWNGIEFLCFPQRTGKYVFSG